MAPIMAYCAGFFKENNGLHVKNRNNTEALSSQASVLFLLFIGYSVNDQITMAFFGQTSAQVPHATHLSSSSFQTFSLRSTVRASPGHLRAQMVQ